MALFEIMANDTPQYPKGDFRRMLVVLAAIDTPQGASLVRIAQRTGLDKKSITRLISQAGEQAAVSITKEGAVYRIGDWGPVIKRHGARITLTGALNAPILKSG